MPDSVLEDWRPEDEAFWESGGRRIAWRNLLISVFTLHLSFGVWAIWSVITVYLPEVGFEYSTSQRFVLAALPSLAGGTGRFAYSFVVPVFGGRRWNTLATATLLVPSVGLGLAVQDPDTPFWVMALLATSAGLGSANFASSMDNISYFFPERLSGTALGINGGLGNVGVSTAQFVIPVAITIGLFGSLGGSPLDATTGDAVAQSVWLQNAGFVWVPFVILGTVASYYGMNDIADAEADVADQLVVLRRKHNWIVCWLYLGTFGSYIGYSFAFPLLVDHQFPGTTVATVAFVGPLLGAVVRAPGGWLADRFGGARVTIAAFLAMTAGTVGVGYFVLAGHFPGFFASFMVLFLATGVGNGSTFEMVPSIFRQRRLAEVADGAGDGTDVGGEGDDGADADAESPRERALSRAQVEAGSALGISGAVGAYGGFLIPQAFSTSLDVAGGTLPALGAFVAFYGTCIALIWYYYGRAGAEAPC